ncbi:hypothetical protein [Breznakia pachnodae]|uniref:Multimeric flavodoxin WrbA n=1 Tax=Breznakia pachnodae TaxID=265178 RepID=A0ABU0E8J5_9FIRM|nr:hypothetical protein [Breznakia pachnodae]MDQ0363135.1 multimeric flavodoxin WrbA [Breznakia pachnodae]
MSTLFINGSPKGKKSNSYTFIEQISAPLQFPYEIRTLASLNTKLLADEIEEYETIIIVMPLYIHAMPGIVKELFEEMKINKKQGRRIGFIVQAGFEESETAKYLVNYLEVFVRRMNYEYMGTIVKPGAAGLALMPRFMFKKLLNQLTQLGVEYNQTQTFSKEMIETLGNPYVLSEKQVKLLCRKPVKWINKLGWHYFLRKNKAYKERLDRPYLLK